MKHLFSFILILLATGTHAQTDSFPSYIRFTYENDFFTATDRYYTQGIKLEYFSPLFKKSPLNYVLLKQKNATQFIYGISAEQDCFTPRSIRHNGIYYNERLYAAVFMLTQYAQSATHTTLLESSINLGVIGPCAMCEEEQKGIHHALNNIQPIGWENQLKTDYIINYHIKWQQYFYKDQLFRMKYNLAARIGTLFNTTDAGLTIETGFLPDRYKRFFAYGFVNTGARAVAYNATLQGGLFTKNNIYTLQPSQLERIIYNGTLGFCLGYKKFSAQYMVHHIGPEFKNGLPHAWGGITFITRW